jgi:hypothetical protein
LKEDVVARARSLVGCRFRPQGRDPELGLDCVGVVCAAFEIPADSIPRDYRLRGGAVGRIEFELKRFFSTVATAAAGDVMLFEVAVNQLHLGILTERGFIHADAGLKAVVETPGMPSWQILSAFRRDEI